MSSTVYSLLFKTLTISTCAAILASVSVDKDVYTTLQPEIIAVADTLPEDTSKNSLGKSGNQFVLRWKDYYSNRLVQPRPRSPFYLKDPANIKTDILLDSTGKIAVTEQIHTPGGTLDYRAPEGMDLEQYDKVQEGRAFKSLLKEYSSRQDGQGAMGTRGLLPKLDVPPALSKLLGDDFLNFKPTGFVSLDLGLMHQFLDNPTIPIRQRRNTQFIFNEQININFDARLGDMLGFQTNFDTKANFNFENAIKLNYKNPEESFIRKIEAGNINWAINSQLIPGVQNLFGLKTDFQFGRLKATFVASQQKSSKERVVLRGGAQGREFEIRADTYDENRNFFLSQYFRNIYENSLRTTPTITSGVTVTRMEVYVTNRTTTTESLRNVVGFADLGEPAPYKSANASLQPIVSSSPAANGANGLFSSLQNNPAFRQVDNTNTSLTTSFGLEKANDYELLRGAKKLVAERDYTFHPQLGYVSLTTALRNDEVLAVAYEYTVNGRSFKVGELTEDYQATQDNEVIVLKLLKSSTIRNNTKLPMWNLMMKNVYALGTSQIDRQGFQLRVIYKDDLTGMDNPQLQDSDIANIPLIRLMGLDRLNPVNDLQPDGNFDYVEGITIDSKTGRIIFPVLEPFGSNLSAKFGAGNEQARSKYVFDELYRTTMIDAQQVTERNKFFLKGSYQSSQGAEVTLPFGVVETSVTVTSGGVPLSPGSDYIVESQLGRVRILNQSVMNSGREIVIEYERPDMFQNQIRSLIGTRLDYAVNRDMSIGLTAMKYRERPAGFLTRVAIGNEPVNNTMLGFDINIRKDVPFLTKMLDKLPFLQTKEMSSIQFKAEFAKLFPGVSKDVNNRSLVDDFEAARTVYDLARQPQKWRLAAVPPKFTDGKAGNDRSYGYKRAKISAYTVDNIFGGQGGLGGGYQIPSNITVSDSNYYEKLYLPNQIFPNRAIAGLVTYPQNILDISYFPSERGMYNYNTDLTNEGRLRMPRQNFGGISRAITSDNDFDNANIESIEFWILDPFINDGTENSKVRDGFENQPNTTGGKLVFNLGDISEDVIPDERYNFENGLPVGPKIVGDNVDSTAWGYVTRSQYLINAFSNEPGARQRQDVGLDGMSNEEERIFFKSYLDALPQGVRERFAQDPSGDDFSFFLGQELDDNNAKVVERYKNYMGMENNSPESQGRATTVTPASTNVPDGEDMNVDNTINDNESYYEYEIDLKPGQLEVGKGFIVDKSVNTKDGKNWYLFRVPIKEFSGQVGGMNGFKSIRFMRMYLTDFQQPVVLRFAQLQMVGQQYRKYTSNLADGGLQEVPEPYDAKFTVGTVSIEENGLSANANNKYVYDIPPGWIRDQDATQRPPLLLNEQSMSLCVTDLRDGDSRGVFKNVNLDLQFRKRLRMYVHMHNEQNEDKKVGAFMRIGTDLTQNYYEIDISELNSTRAGQSARGEIWPEENELNIAIADLINAKAARNRDFGRTSGNAYPTQSSDGRYTITVVGNPDLSSVRVMMIGMRNPKSDDERSKSFCIWVDEMHVEGFDETGGMAAIAQLNAKLADFATVTASGRIETFGFGSVQQRIGERSRNLTTEYGFSSNVALDKLLPQKWGFVIPVFLSYDRRNVKPHFDPLDPDTELTTSLSNLRSDEERDGYRRMVEENAVKRGINFSNVRKVKTRPGAKNHFYDFENFAFTYAYSDDNRRNILTQEYAQRMYKGGIAYVYSSQPKAFEPFKNYEVKNRWGELLKDFNLTLLPNMVSVRADVDRRFLKTQLRNADLTTDGVQPLYEKYFWFNRYYDFNWNLTRNMTLAYNSSANSVIDEPMGDINTAEKKDSLWANFRKLGRIKNFDQRISLTYRLPLNKIPLTDWMSADYKHSVGYQYQANAYGLVDSTGNLFGDIIRNSRERGVSGKVDFVMLYNKLRYLKFANTPSVARKNFARSPGDVEDINLNSTDFLKSVTRMLMTVRGINFNYSLLETTSLPGYLRAPEYFGLDNTFAPGMRFVMGEQDRDFHKMAASKGWITRSKEQNQPFQMTVAKNFTANTTLEPTKDFRMIIDVRLTRQDAYQEFYRPTGIAEFETQNPLRNGQFSMSFWSFRTAFAKMPRDNSSEVFDKFNNYRHEIIKILNDKNPEVKGDESLYNSTSQDVLMASFFSAYSGKGIADPSKVRVNPFLKFPMPNWEVTYSGLSNLAGFKKLFSSFTLRHKYYSNYSVGNFTSNQGFDETYVNLAVNGYPLSARQNVGVEALLGQFTPVFSMSTITMAERFQPLLGVEFRTIGKITARFEYNRDRSVALNLSNSQVAELFNQDLTVNIGLTKNNVPLPFKINGVKKKLKNDLTMQLGMTFRDTRSIQRKFGKEVVVNGVTTNVSENTPIAGNINFQLRPTVNYMVNNRLSLMFYFDRTFNDPLVSNSFYRASTSGGIQVRFNLAE